MSTTLKIKVTKEILRKSAGCAYPKLENNCAIALAVREIFPKAKVESDYIFPFGRESYSTSIDLPTKAKNFIDKFDEKDFAARIKMRPIEFTISIPNKVINKINIDELKPLLVNHPTLELIS